MLKTGIRNMAAITAAFLLYGLLRVILYGQDFADLISQLFSGAVVFVWGEFIWGRVTDSLTVYAHYRHLHDDYRAATEDAPIFDRCSSSEGKTLGYVEAGETVIVRKESKKGLFAWVTHDGVSGWVQTRYLAAGNIMEAKGDRKEDMAIRSEAKYKKGTVYRNVGQVELFLVIIAENSYYKVAYPCSEGYAYIAKDQLKER